MLRLSQDLHRNRTWPIAAMLSQEGDTAAPRDADDRISIQHLVDYGHKVYNKRKIKKKEYKWKMRKIYMNNIKIKLPKTAIIQKK